ncbi:MAG TPA: xanthine dehydrogenase family protein subunit M [Ktedonobacterales bacterium]|nr:xanthine dehydrogenase family protein subunit M [Ktedonobacterales bacterium]
MKPAAFTYYDPTTTAEALALLGELSEDAKVMAGGQSLMPMMNMRLARPAAIIDINRVSELAYLNETQDGLSIGALTRQRAVERSVAVKQRFPLLAEAILSIGHPPIRARGTIGGSLAHADPAAELPAVLLALDGWVQASSARGTRQIAAADLFVGPLATSLEPDELLTEAYFPALPPGTGTAFLEVTRRHGDFALVGVAACLTLDQQGVCTRVSIALLGAGDTQTRASEAEACLLGQSVSEPAIEAAGAAAMASLEPMGDIHASSAYRKQVAGVLTRRALGIAWERAKGASYE